MCVQVIFLRLKGFSESHQRISIAIVCERVGRDRRYSGLCKQVQREICTQVIPLCWTNRAAGDAFPSVRFYCLAPAILFWGSRCEPCTVRAVRCASSGSASGANCIGGGWVVSMLKLGVWWWVASRCVLLNFAPSVDGPSTGSGRTVQI